MNSRSSGPKPDALDRWATPRYINSFFKTSIQPANRKSPFMLFILIWIVPYSNLFCLFLWLDLLIEQYGLKKFFLGILVIFCQYFIDFFILFLSCSIICTRISWIFICKNFLKNNNINLIILASELAKSMLFQALPSHPFLYPSAQYKEMPAMNRGSFIRVLASSLPILYVV